MQTTVQRLCRTCLYTSKNVTEFVGINTMDPLKKISTRSKIEMCIPEIEVEDPDSTFLCIACWNALNASFNFKCVCLATEEKLRKSLSHSKEEVNKCNKDILYTEIDLLLDDIFTTDKTRTDLYKQANFFLEAQKVIKQYCYSKKNDTEHNSALRRPKWTETESSDHKNNMEHNSALKRIKRTATESSDQKNNTERNSALKRITRTATESSDQKNNMERNSALKKPKRTATESSTNPTTEKPKWKCKRCSKEFFDSKRFKCHVHKCGIYVVVCKRCRKGFYFRHTYVRHTYFCNASKDVKQTEVSNKNATTLKQTRKIVKETEVSNKNATTCNKKMDLLSNNLSVKKKKVNYQSNNKKDAQCPMCPKQFRDKWHLRRHIEVHLKQRKRSISTVHSKDVPPIEVPPPVQSSSQEISNDGDRCENKNIESVTVKNEEEAADKEEINTIFFKIEKEEHEEDER